MIAEGVNAGSWKGPGPMAKAWRDYLVAWEDWRLEVDEYRELDDERVPVLARRRGRGSSAAWSSDSWPTEPRA